MIKTDVSGIDEAFREFDEAITDGMISAASEGTERARESGTYQNRTFRLRNANGYAVLRDGKIKKMEVIGNNPESKDKTENYLTYGNNPKDGIVLANGMEYASYVESRGFNVLGSEAIGTEAELKEKFE